ncbi:hypothetical protein GCM10010174_32970 [Kutzneria viridogrisea]|uniref:Glycoprotein n=1 Tax=Kutzneria viridogrisea TaxID=47990 RepID=A0ABR6BR50_9PSEU|nr:hypothetical protein [Kutzneria viridogrisea]
MKRVLAALAAAAFTVVLSPGAYAAPPQASDQQNRIRIDVNPLHPQLVTSDQQDTLSVSGTLTNVGDRKVDRLDVRLERGGKLDENGLRGALQKPTPTNEVSTNFLNQVASLAPGQSVPFTLNVSLHGQAGESLLINEPGVYPLVVNANGTPDYGQRAKVGQSLTLLPVLGVPGGPSLPKPASPAKLTVLWPLADRPRVLDESQPNAPVLTDDDLATSLAPGGRLDALLGALESAPSGLTGSLCVAVDPDLAVTVRGMTGDYQVRGADGENHPGKGQAAASSWLSRLKQYVQGKCFFALPFADADITALNTANAHGLIGSAVSEGNSNLLKDLLGASPVQHLVWPINGQVDAKTVTDLAGAGVQDVLVSGAVVPGADPVRLGSDKGPRAVRTDDLVAAALASGSGSVQAALAAAQLRASSGQPLVVAPPHQWTVSSADAKGLLDGLQSLVSQQYLAAGSLSPLLAGAVAGKVADPQYTPPYAPNMDAVQEKASAATDLINSMDQDASLAVTPQAFMAPVVNDLVRSASGAWAGDEAGARQSLEHANELIDGVRQGVFVVQPTSPISLASEDAPLPVRVTNRLPVLVKVKVRLSNTTGINPDEVPVQLIPARNSRDVQIPSKVVRTGQFSVDATVYTQTGNHRLGSSGRFELSSTAVGVTTLVITGFAAAALFALSGLRIYRRLKASRARRAEAAAPVEPVPSELAPAPVHAKQHVEQS